MMSAVCTVNTEIGRKMEAAHFACNGGAEVDQGEAVSALLEPLSVSTMVPTPLPPAAVRRGRRKGKGKRKGKKRCGKVDLDVLSNFFGSVWEKKACILKEVGWVSQEDDTILADSVMADIDTLNPTLSMGLADTKELCLER